MASIPSPSATDLETRLLMLKSLIKTHNKLISRSILPIAATAYTSASNALSAVTHAPLKPLLEELEAAALTMAPGPFAKALLERHQEQLADLKLFETNNLDTHPLLTEAGAVAYVARQQADLTTKTRRYLLEMIVMAERVDREMAVKVRSREGDFQKYLTADFSGYLELKFFLDRVTGEGW
ncbi:hypothetical protein EJ02DRAFT_480719 [Clathrospora elynae]|uniref:Uncharacterized protein n=1 Tax=Clathrospora elynae TaxID=706981 RepID=A0A6A5SA58_9PLEO|nr:hypothetical protein EJ02DRAFT_480719 [Clathrospora elynae]